MTVRFLSDRRAAGYEAVKIQQLMYCSIIYCRQSRSGIRLQITSPRQCVLVFGSRSGLYRIHKPDPSRVCNGHDTWKDPSFLKGGFYFTRDGKSSAYCSRSSAPSTNQKEEKEEEEEKEEKEEEEEEEKPGS